MTEISKPLFVETLPNLDETTVVKDKIKLALYDDKDKPNQLLFNDIQNGSIGRVVSVEASLANNPYAFKELTVSGNIVLYYGEFIDWTRRSYISNAMPNYHGTSEGRITVVTLSTPLSIVWNSAFLDAWIQFQVPWITSSLEGGSRAYSSSTYTIPPFTEFTIEYTNNFTKASTRNEMIYFTVIK